MKRFVLTIAAVLALLLSGCQANNETDISAYGDDIAKAQEIAVVSADTPEVLETITSKEDIEHFIMSLDLDNWALKELPKDATTIGSFILFQEETKKWGQVDTDGTLHEIATFTYYDNSYISFEIGGFDMAFGVSDDTTNYLNGYFE